VGRLVRPSMFLTPRDKELFDYLFLNKISTAMQINRDIFGMSNTKDVLRRLRTLIRHGYIRRTSTGEKATKFGYFLSDKSFKMFISRRIERSWTQLKSDSANHDIVLVDIRHRLTKSQKVARFFTENAIESGLTGDSTFPSEPFLEMHSDAAIIFKYNGKSFNVAIEYEDSLKSESRYQAHLNSYYLKKEIHGVLYITKEQSLRENLARLDKPLCRDRSSKVFLGNLVDVLSSKPLHFGPNNTGNFLQLE